MRREPPELPRDQWDSPIPDYDLLTDEACKLIFEQAQAYFGEIKEEGIELTQRSMRMLFLFLPAIAAVTGYCISNRDQLKNPGIIGYILLGIISINACFCLFCLFKLISPKKIHYHGGRPEEVIRPEILELKNAKKIQKALDVSEIERYEVKIEQMEYWKNRRIALYSYLIYSFNMMLFFGILLLLLSI